MKKLIVIILVLIGFNSFGQTYLVQPAKWKFTNSQRFDSTVRFYNLPILTGDTVLGFNPYSKKIGLKIISSTSYSAGNGLLLGGTTFYADTTKLVSTHGNQNIYGNKSFWGDIINYGNYNNYAIAGHVLTGTGGFMWNGHDEKVTSGATTARTWRMPDSTGTVALLSNIPTNYWSTSGNTFSNGNYLGTNNNRGFGIRTNAKQSIYIDSMPRCARVGIGQNPLSNDTSRLQVNGGLLIDTILKVSNGSSATISQSGSKYFSKINSTYRVGHIFTGQTHTFSTGYSYNTINEASVTVGSAGFINNLIISQLGNFSSGGGDMVGLAISTSVFGSNPSSYKALLIDHNFGNGIYQSGASVKNWFGGKVGIGSGKSSPVYGLDINCRVGINQDSLPTGASTDSVVMIRTSTNQLTKRAASSFGSSYTAGRGLTLNSNIFRLDTAIVSNLAYISANSTTTAKSVYQMGSTVPVEFKSSDANTLLYLDETNEKVGIGTSSPSLTTHVLYSKGASTSSQGGIYIQNGDDAGYSSLQMRCGNGGVSQHILYGTTGAVPNLYAFYQPSTVGYAFSEKVNIGSIAQGKGMLTIPVAPSVNANYGTASIGGGNFAGSGFTGSSSGTSLMISEVSGFAGDYVNFGKGTTSYFKVDNVGNTTAAKYYVSALNTAPSSASDTGTAGEIRFASDGYLYLATATNTWIRVQLNTW